MMEGARAACVFILPKSKYRVTKGFKFHAQPKTGAYSCLNCVHDNKLLHTPVKVVPHLGWLLCCQGAFQQTYKSRDPLYHH